MPSTDTVIRSRTSALAAWEVPLGAALLAADAAVGAPEGAGFRPADVRFFFLLFTNWMGDDHLRPGADLEATQVRRTLEHLAAGGLAAAVAPGAVRSERPSSGGPSSGGPSSGGGRAPRWLLTPAGVVRLVESITDPRAPRRFEEVVLLATVATSYADTIAARVRTSGRSEERRIRARLAPRAILRAERRRLEDALLDVQARRDAGPEIAAAARAALAEGLDPLAAAARLEALGKTYQLHPMRPFREVIAGLPAPLRRYELTEGPAVRARLVFGPLCEELRARIGILERMEAGIAD